MPMKIVSIIKLMASEREKLQSESNSKRVIQGEAPLDTRACPLPGDPERIGKIRGGNKPESMNEFLKTRDSLSDFIRPSVLNGNCLSHLAAEERSFDKRGGGEGPGGGGGRISIFLGEDNDGYDLVLFADRYPRVRILRYGISRAHRNKSNNVNNERSNGDARQSEACVAV